MKPLTRLVTFILGLGLALVLLLPVWWVGLASLVSERFLFSDARFTLSELGFDHYRSLFQVRGFAVAIENSLIVAGTTTTLCVALGSLSAYALVRLEFRGKALVTVLLLSVSTFPQISIVEPLYAILRAVHLVNTYPGLVLPYLTFTLPLTVFLLVGFFRQLQPEIEQAAMLDGASTWAVFWHIVLPLSLPGVIATAIISFVYCWNEFLFALSFSVGPARQTLPVAVALLQGQHQIPWGEVFAAAVVATLPAVALVLVFQRRILQGLLGAGGTTSPG